MCANIALDIAATNEQGYHVYQPEDRIETDAHSGLDIELDEATKTNENLIVRHGTRPRVRE